MLGSKYDGRMVRFFRHFKHAIVAVGYLLEIARPRGVQKYSFSMNIRKRSLRLEADTGTNVDDTE